MIRTNESPKKLPPRFFLALSLALALAAGVAACAKDEGEEAAAGADPAASESTTPDGAAAPGSPGAAGTTAPAEPFDPDALPEVVARVNGEEIKKVELIKGAQQAQAQLAQMGQRPSSQGKQFFREVLDTMIAQILLEQEAKKQGVTASEEEAKQQVEGLRRSMPGEAFQQALQSEGMTEAELVASVREQLAARKYLQSQVADVPQVSPEEARAWYQSHPEQVQQPEGVRARHILVAAEANAPEAEKQKARQEAEDLLARARKGEDFAALAAEHSDDPGSKVRGGELPWFSRGQMVPPFEQAAFALKEPNELSPVVESPFGYHVIQLLERKEPQPIPFEQVRERIAAGLRQEKQQEKVSRHVSSLREKAKVEVFL
jgi:peptidyl-prolyl cis-trans isomerase C